MPWQTWASSGCNSSYQFLEFAVQFFPSFPSRLRDRLRREHSRWFGEVQRYLAGGWISAFAEMTNRGGTANLAIRYQAVPAGGVGACRVRSRACMISTIRSASSCVQRGGTGP